MSFSVDDLASSFSSNHVGQEAIDLALLQNQLAQTLCEGSTFSGSPKSYNRGHTTVLPPRGRGQVQPCTTPIARTPSLSANPSWCLAMEITRSRRNSVSAYLEGQMDVEMTISMDYLRSHTSESPSGLMDDIEQDEGSVEDLLIPSPPSSAPLSGSHFGTASPSPASSIQKSSKLFNADQPHVPSMTSPDMSPSSPTGSIFTSTDPFYLAQLQSMNTAAHSQSFFAQSGRLPQNSPFALPGHLHSHGQFDRMSM